MKKTKRIKIQKSYNVAQLLEENLFLHSTFHRMLVTSDYYFHTGNSECLKKRKFIVGQKDTYRRNLEKIISQIVDVQNGFFYFFLFTNFFLPLIFCLFVAYYFLLRFEIILLSRKTKMEIMRC